MENLLLTFEDEDMPDLYYKLIAIKNQIDDSKLSSCHNDDPDDMCENCNCWKHTRMMCS